MATVRTNADDIQRQMAEIRSDIHYEMREVVNVAATAADWRSYIRARPWLSIGLAFTTGFILVPRRSRPANVIVPQAAVDMGNGRLAAKAEREEKPRRGSALRWILGVVAPVVVRAGQSYALNYVEGLLANHQQTGPGTEPAARPSWAGPTSRNEGRGFVTRG